MNVPKKRYLDVDTTDDFLDKDPIRYSDGTALADTDFSAEAIRAREKLRGRKTPELPPLTES